jgi:hypothetical protein
MMAPMLLAGAGAGSGPKSYCAVGWPLLAQAPSSAAMAAARALRMVVVIISFPYLL